MSILHGDPLVSVADDPLLAGDKRSRAEQLADALNDTNIGRDARAWEKGDYHRVYFRLGRKDAKAYIDVDPSYDAPDLYAGCALRVRVDSENRKWAVSQAKQIKHSLMVDLHEAAVAGEIDSPTLAEPICEDWREVIL